MGCKNLRINWVLILDLESELGCLMMKVFSKIPNTVKVVGLVSFLINASTLMIFSLFGLYLHNRLHVSFSKIGFLDGAVEACSFVMKIFSGVMSDFLMNRKLIFLIGAIFLFVAKPLEAVATTYWPLFQAKILERVGNGLQSTPRDAIVGDWAPSDRKATCFGMRQSFAAFGAVVGAIIAAILLRQSSGDFQFVFWMATIPAFLSVCIIIFFVKDKQTAISRRTLKKSKHRKITWKDIRNLGTEFWLLIGVACTYTISKVSESLVILYVTSALGLPDYMGAFVMVLYQLGNSFVSFPAGIISDRIKSRSDIFIAGIIIFLISDLLFIYGGHNLIMMVVALLCLGMYIGITQSIFPAKIIDLVPADLKGTGIGIFNLVCALSFFSGGLLMGHISDIYSPRHSFIVSSGLASISLCTLIIYKAIGKKLKAK